MMPESSSISEILRRQASRAGAERRIRVMQGRGWGGGGKGDDGDDAV